LATVLITIWTQGLNGLPNIAALISLIRTLFDVCLWIYDVDTHNESSGFPNRSIAIAIGIALASWNSPVFELYGFLAAIISTISQAFLNISSKRAMTIANLGGLEAQRAMASVAFCITVSVVMLHSITHLLTSSWNQYDQKSVTDWKGNPPLTLSLGASIAYHVEYLLSFLFVRLVQPITYGAFDAVRRLGIIIAGRAMFGGEKFTVTNRIGVMMTLLGAFFYSMTLAK
jgi:hypothetical protein